MPVKHSAV